MKQTPPNGTAKQHVRETHRQMRERCSAEETIRNLFENCFLPGDVEAKMGGWADHQNHCRCHDCSGNPIPADVHTRRGLVIPEMSEAIEKVSIEYRRVPLETCGSDTINSGA